MQLSGFMKTNRGLKAATLSEKQYGTKISYLICFPLKHARTAQLIIELSYKSGITWLKVAVPKSIKVPRETLFMGSSIEKSAKLQTLNNFNP
jgi:hypothetical protein